MVCMMVWHHLQVDAQQMMKRNMPWMTVCTTPYAYIPPLQCGLITEANRAICIYNQTSIFNANNPMAAYSNFFSVLYSISLQMRSSAPSRRIPISVASVIPMASSQGRRRVHAGLVVQVGLGKVEVEDEVGHLQDENDHVDEHAIGVDMQSQSMHDAKPAVRWVKGYVLDILVDLVISIGAVVGVRVVGRRGEVVFGVDWLWGLVVDADRRCYLVVVGGLLGRLIGDACVGGRGWLVGDWVVVGGQQFEQVIIDDYLAEIDVLSAEGALPSGLQIVHALPADSVMHAADDDWLLFPSIILLVADIAFGDITQLFCQTGTVSERHE